MKGSRGRNLRRRSLEAANEAEAMEECCRLACFVTASSPLSNGDITYGELASLTLISNRENGHSPLRLETFS